MGVPHISAGDLVRDEIKRGSPLAKEARAAGPASPPRLTLPASRPRPPATAPFRPAPASTATRPPAPPPPPARSSATSVLSFPGSPRRRWRPRRRQASSSRMRSSFASSRNASIKGEPRPPPSHPTPLSHDHWRPASLLLPHRPRCSSQRGQEPLTGSPRRAPGRCATRRKRSGEPGCLLDGFPRTRHQAVRARPPSLALRPPTSHAPSAHPVLPPHPLTRVRPYPPVSARVRQELLSETLDVHQAVNFSLREHILILKARCSNALCSNARCSNTSVRTGFERAGSVAPHPPGAVLREAGVQGVRGELQHGPDRLSGATSRALTGQILSFSFSPSASCDAFGVLPSCGGVPEGSKPRHFPPPPPQATATEPAIFMPPLDPPPQCAGKMEVRPDDTEEVRPRTRPDHPPPPALRFLPATPPLATAPPRPRPPAHRARPPAAAPGPPLPGGEAPPRGVQGAVRPRGGVLPGERFALRVPDPGWDPGDAPEAAAGGGGAAGAGEQGGQMTSGGVQEAV